MSGRADKINYLRIHKKGKAQHQERQPHQTTLHPRIRRASYPRILQQQQLDRKLWQHYVIQDALVCSTNNDAHTVSSASNIKSTTIFTPTMATSLALRLTLVGSSLLSSLPTLRSIPAFQPRPSVECYHI